MVGNTDFYKAMLPENAKLYKKKSMQMTCDYTVHLSGSYDNRLSGFLESVVTG